MHALNAYGRAFLLNRFHETRKMIEARRKNAPLEDAGQLENGKKHIPDSPLEGGLLEPPIDKRMQPESLGN